jgi:hypothetical protein
VEGSTVEVEFFTSAYELSIVTMDAPSLEVENENASAGSAAVRLARRCAGKDADTFVSNLKIYGSPGFGGKFRHRDA